MASIKLSDAKIKTLKPQEKTYRILDADRLYIEVRPSGAKIWRFKFVLNGKESSMSLGEYPSITLAEARTLKEEMRAKFQDLNEKHKDKHIRQKLTKCNYMLQKILNSPRDDLNARASEMCSWIESESIS